jgi:hypothetical protein
MYTDFDTTQPATKLGFTLPVGPISKDLPPISDVLDAETLTELIKQKALVNVDVLSEILMTKAINPAASAKVVVDALDANYKLSGLAAKNVAKELAGIVSITINMPSKTTAPKVIEGATTEVEEAEVVDGTPSPQD